MKNLFVVTKNELLRYFISPLAYVYLISFLILNGVAAFYFGHLFERSQASLYYMFVYQPFLYLLFLPGIAMRLFAEEFRNKTIVTLMTEPISIVTIVWGKFLAAWIFAGLALALTFEFVITINILGHPDNGVIALSYLGSFMLAGAMLSIAQTMSALTKNQVIALVLAVIANLLFFFFGMEFVLMFFRLFLPDYIVDTIASFSFLTHYNGLISGIIEWRDVLFFASLIILFNFTTMLVVSFKTSGTSSWLKSNDNRTYICAFFALMLGFVGFNLLANHLTADTELDVTEEQFYTLSPSTIHILEELDEPVTAKLYFSDILAKQNPNLRVMFNRVKMLLAHYKAASKGKFDYRIYRPKHLDKYEDRAISDGLQPVPLIDLNQNALFGLSITDTLDRKAVIAYLSPDRIKNLEQDLTALIYGLYHQKKTIGLISSLPVLGQNINGVVMAQYEMLDKIKQFYNIKVIEKPQNVEEIDVLMMIHPKDLSDEMTHAIENYVKNDGKVLLFLDTAAEAKRLYMPENAPYMPSDLNGLDRFFGFEFYSDYVVADLENSITVDATTNYQNNPAFTQDIIQFKLKDENFNPFHPVTKNLHTLLMSSASVLMPRQGADIRFMPLMQASSDSALMSSELVYKNLNPRQILSYYQKDDNVKFLSAYITSDLPDKKFELIVTADTDFLYDNFWGRKQIFLEKKYFIPLFSNADFVLNALDFLTSNTRLIGLRGKGAKNRAFNDIEKLRKESIFRYKLKEEEIFQAIEQAKQNLQEIFEKRNFEERENFSADELAIITGIKKELDLLRTELSNVRTKSLSAIENTALKVKLINIFSIPLLLVLILCIVMLNQKKSIKELKNDTLRLNKPLLKLIIFATIILLAGVASVYLSNISDISTYEEKPVLPDLKNKINDVTSIRLQNHATTLTFNRKNDVWKIEEMPDMVVYQERIKSLLSALIESTFYEKKSDKAENLAYFGLSPVEMETSQKTIIKLSDKNQNPISTLEIGKYNIELGRGTSAAYAKFEDKFQVWLIAAEFVDLSLDFHEWTYSSLWNLRFGRVKSYNNTDDATKLPVIVSTLLNVKFIGAQKDLTDMALIKYNHLKTEDDLQISFSVFKKDNRYYIKYDLPVQKANKHLDFFGAYAKNTYFEISQKDYEKLNELEAR